MNRFWWLGLVLGCAVGCVSGEKTETVPANPFGNGARVEPARNASFAPAPSEISARVDQVGRKILAANPQIGVKPLFATIGSPSPEVFHQGTTMVFITMGLVQQCKTEAQLAAILSRELGKMVSEREARTSAGTRDPERLPPMEVPIGQAGMSSFNSSPDMTHMAEMGRFENTHPRRRGPLPAPDPMALAPLYLPKARSREADLDFARPPLNPAA